MINSKALLFSCAMVMIFWSGTNAEIVAAVRAQYPRYHGTIVLPTNTAHPTALCKEIMNSPKAFWANFQHVDNICNTRIQCAIPNFAQTSVLDKFPPQGSVRQKHICINETLHPVRDADNYR